MPKSMTFRRPDSAEHQVRGFEIAMDDAHAVRMAERRERLRDEVHGAIGGYRTLARDEILERLAAHELDGHQPLAVVLEELEDRRDARMVQPRDRHRLGTEPPADAGIVQLGVENLERDVAVQRLVHRAVHGAHAATADLFDDPVFPELLTDKGHGRAPWKVYIGARPVIGLSGYRTIDHRVIGLSIIGSSHRVIRVADSPMPDSPMIR